MRNQRGWIVSLLAASLLTCLPPASAWAANPATKLSRGIVNLVSGWLEFPLKMAEEESRSDTKVLWIAHGTMRGLGAAGARTLYGLWDIVTFPVAPYNRPTLDPDTLIEPNDPPLEVQPFPTETEAQ